MRTCIPVLIGALAAPLLGCGGEPPPPPPPPPPVEQLDPASPEFAVDEWLEHYSAGRYDEAQRLLGPDVAAEERSMPGSVLRAFEQQEMRVHSVLKRDVRVAGDQAWVLVHLMMKDEIGRPEPWVVRFELRRDADGWQIVDLRRGA